MHHHHHSFIPHHLVGKFLFWFVMIVLVSWIVLQFWAPTFVQRKDGNGNPTGEIDTTMVLITAIIVAIIISLILCFSKSWTYY